MVWRTRGAVGRDLETLGHLLRTLLPFDRNPVPAEWTHITKVDPEPEKQFPTLYPLYLQHTDAVSVGGSSNVTDRNTEETFELLEEARTKAFHEPSEARHVTRNTISAAEFLAIPEVLNGHSDALVGTLGEGIHYLESEIVPEIVSRTVPGWVRSGRREQLVSVLVDILLQRAVFEAYIIQNPESEAAKQSGVSKSDTLTPAEARDRAMAAERHLDSEIIYLEYSGTFGDDEAEAILNEISGGVTGPRIWYGGGIDSREKATKMLQAGADTVIVGDIFHDIADEERQLFDELREDVEGAPTRSNIADWLREHVDMEATSAARYLSTIPSVERPTDTARRYLSLTLSLVMAVRESRDHDAATLEGTLRGDGLPDIWTGEEPGITTVSAVVPDAPTILPAIVRAIADGAADSPLPAHHLSFGPREPTDG